MISGIRRIFFGNNGTSQGRNVILTGIPRSGTTLACKILLNDENQIALNEPIAGTYFKPGISGADVVKNCFKMYRRGLLKNGKAPVRAKDGQITDNAYSQDAEKREKILERAMVHFDKRLDRNFTLIMKHCAEFSLILPSLRNEYECFAIIRNPLSTLASWNSVNVPVSRGKVAKSRLLKPELYEKLEKIRTLEEKQLCILDWYYEQYRILDRKNIVTYESIIESQGRILSVVSGKESGADEQLSSKNENVLYDKGRMADILKRLTDRAGSYMEFYSRSELEESAGKMGL